MTRKIIQIAATTAPETEDDYPDHRIFALCNDGNVYMTFCNTRCYFEEWEKLPSIPQYEDK